MRLEEQLEAADRVLVVADQLAEWCRVATSVKGVFSNNLGAQAQGQGMANLVVRYIATRESYPATSDPFTGEPGPEDVSMYVEPDPATKREE